MSYEIKVCKGTMAEQAQSMIDHASEFLLEVGMQVCNMLFIICHTLQKAGEEFLVPWKDLFITTEDPDRTKGLLIKAPAGTSCCHSRFCAAWPAASFTTCSPSPGMAPK